MGGVSRSRGDPPAAEDCRGVAQSLDSLRSLGMPSEVEARQDPQPNGFPLDKVYLLHYISLV